MRVADMHCDTLSKLMKHTEWSLEENELHIRLDKMEAGAYLLQNFAMFVFLEKGKSPYEAALRMADRFDGQMRLFSDRIVPVRSFADIEGARAAGKIGAMLTIEEGAVIEGSLEKLREFYDRGVRMMTLTWNFPNEIGFPNVALTLDGDRPNDTKPDHTKPDHTKTNRTKPDHITPQTQKGLTALGITVVEEMQRMGMIVDVSHLSDAGFWDVYRNTGKPFVASHSNARSLCPHVRNLTDEMIRALGERGGVTGLNFCVDFLIDTSRQQKTDDVLDAAARHARHIVDVGGMDCLGLGSDFDGIDTPPQLTGADKLPLLDAALEKGGFSASQREKIFSGNVLRLYRELL